MKLIQTSLIILLFLAGCWLGSDIFLDKTQKVSQTNHLVKMAHEVKKGDTLFALALKHKIKVSELKKFNRLAQNKDLISLGQVILIPKREREVSDGTASWYGPGFHGRRMANGEVYNQNDPTVVAHRELPLGTDVLIINLENSKTAVAQVSDRGPYIEDRWGNFTRDLDCSKALAKKLGFVEKGLTKVRIVALPNNNPSKG